MKNMAQKFLSEQERKQVEEAVQAAEKKTAGEIVCLIESASYRYPMANVIGATISAIPLALVLTHILGGWLWIGTQNLWLFIGVLGVLWVVFYLMVDRVPVIKRWFVSKKEMDEEVEEAAVTSFFNHGLYRTRDANGILLFISVFERKVWILADHGINAKVPTGQWDDIVAQVTEGVRKGDRAQAISIAVATIGDMLAAHFPIKADDTDELRNLIVG